MAGSLLAIWDRTFSGTLAVKYQHTDALGSPVAVTNTAGTVIDRTHWEPYGAAIGKPSYQGVGYTGHVMDAATGLTYMQQRYYDPQLGVFLSVDPVTAYDDPVLYFHRYRYAGNNPYKFTDPDGRCYLFCQPPGTYNPHAPIPGAERGDAQVVGLVAGSAVAGAVGAVGGCAAVAAGGRAILASGEAASLKAGMAAQHATNATSNALAVATKATAVAATNATARVAVAVEGEASMVAIYAGASTSKANAIGASAAAATPAVIAEFAAGVVTGASGIKSPASSASNMAGDFAGSVLNEELKMQK